MNTPPTSLVIQMKEKDVSKNTLFVLESMEKIRNEVLTNLEASDSQKQDYLRLTSELASGINDLLSENDVTSKYASEITRTIKNNAALLNYDFKQKNFWSKIDPIIRNTANDISVQLLKDDFKGEEQSYHILQALKYLSAKNLEGIEGTYTTILPANSPMENATLAGQITKYLSNILVSKQGALGFRANLDVDAVVSVAEESGLAFIDVPQANYKALKAKYPRSTMVEEGKVKFARIVFSNPDVEEMGNVFESLKEYALTDFGDVEDNLQVDFSDFYGFGKQFHESLCNTIAPFEEQILEKIGSKTKVASRVARGLENEVILDSSSAVKGDTKTQNDWISYWQKDGLDAEFASASDYYKVFKQIRRDLEGSDDEKKEANKLLKSLRKDFKDSLIVTSTRLTYNTNAENRLEARITQHYGSKNQSLTKETTLNIPEYRDVLIDSVVASEDGLNYLQTFFDTDDDAATLVNNLEYISGKSRNGIKVWSAAMSDRMSVPDRAAFLYCDEVNSFHVDGDGNLSGIGRARGVRYQ
ncbi:MAG: hypothetical protein ACP5N2_03755 [Candidatus Nanoarchaeia archaeon]